MSRDGLLDAAQWEHGVGLWERAKGNLVRSEVAEPMRSFAAGYLLLVVVLGPPVMVWLGVSIWGEASAFSVLLAGSGIFIGVVGARRLLTGTSPGTGSGFSWRVAGALLGAVLSGIALIVQEFVLGGFGG